MKVFQMLRDHLICGINHPAIQKTLLAETDLTLDKALDIAQALEATEKGTKILKWKSLQLLGQAILCLKVIIVVHRRKH